MRRLVQTTVYLDEGMIERLDQISEVSRVPKSVIVRQGIDLVLSRYGAEWMTLEADFKPSR